jgi:hypothetical protein
VRRGTTISGAGAARGGDDGDICAGSERNADMGGEVRDVARALLRAHGRRGVPDPVLLRSTLLASAHEIQRCTCFKQRCPEIPFWVFRSGYARALCEGAIRTGAFQGDDDQGQTICNYCNPYTRLSVRARASWRHFFEMPPYALPLHTVPTLLLGCSALRALSFLFAISWSVGVGLPW